jgi:hypothetical protein
VPVGTGGVRGGASSSNGRAEGQITRLELFQHQLYSRAGFDPLHRHILPAVGFHAKCGRAAGPGEHVSSGAASSRTSATLCSSDTPNGRGERGTWPGQGNRRADACAHVGLRHGTVPRHAATPVLRPPPGRGRLPGRPPRPRPGRARLLPRHHLPRRPALLGPRRRPGARHPPRARVPGPDARPPPPDALPRQRRGRTRPRRHPVPVPLGAGRQPRLPARPAHGPAAALLQRAGQLKRLSRRCAATRR